MGKSSYFKDSKQYEISPILANQKGKTETWRFTKKGTVLYLDFQPSQNCKLQTVNTSFILVLWTSYWFQSIGNVTKISKMYTFLKIES